MKNEAKKTEGAGKTAKPEFVGRTFEGVRYEVHSRLIGDDGLWYGATSYKSLSDAQEHLQGLLRCDRRQTEGGIVLEFETDGDRYERRLVKVVKRCEVLSLGVDSR